MRVEKKRECCDIVTGMCTALKEATLNNARWPKRRGRQYNCMHNHSELTHAFH